MKKYLFIVVLLLLSGCDQPYRTDSRTLKDVAESITYTKDSKGNCYAVLEMGKMNDFSTVAFTYVPCDKAGL